MTMRERAGGPSPSINALGVDLRHGEGAAGDPLRLDLPQARHPPLEDEPHRVTPLKVSIAGVVASLLLILLIFELVRSRRLRERYALLWLLTRIVLLVLSAWREGLNTIAGWVGVCRSRLRCSSPWRGCS